MDSQSGEDRGMRPGKNGQGWKSVHHVTPEDVEATGLSAAQALTFHRRLGLVLHEFGFSPQDVWQRVSQRLLRPQHPHALHQLMYYSTYAHWDVSKLGPPLVWFPSKEEASKTNVARLLEVRGEEFLGSNYILDPITSFPAFQRWTVQDPERYWPVVLEQISVSFEVPPQRILDVADTSIPGGRWLPGAVLNIAECCLSEKPGIGKKDDNAAIIWREEGYDDLPVKTVTYAQLRRDVHRAANALEGAGFERGDPIVIDMAMNDHAICIYLALVLAGCVVVSIADSFAAPEIATRVRVSKAKAIFTQDVIPRGGKLVPLYSRVVEARAPRAVVIPAAGRKLSVSLREGDMSWDEFLANASRQNRPTEYQAVRVPAESVMNILFSSGTTGEPKAIPWTHATPLKCSTDAWVHQDQKPGDILTMPTNLGWMVGPAMLFACFLTGSTLGVYKGSPLERSYGKFIQDSGTTILGVVPSMVKTWKTTSCMAGFDWSKIRSIFSTGEASDLDDDLWLCGRCGYCPLLEICGGTELGAAYLHGSLLQPQGLAVFSTPAVGTSFVILNEQGVPYPDSEPCIGEAALHPSFLGASTFILNADHDAVYFRDMPFHEGQRLRRHGDIMERLVGGYYKAHGRADDTMNLGGIKASAVEIERVCNTAHGRVVETVALGVPAVGGGPDSLLLVCVVKEGPEVPVDELKQAFSLAIFKQLNPLFRVSAVAVVPEFPRTATNKIMRRVLRDQFIKLRRSKL